MQIRLTPIPCPLPEYLRLEDDADCCAAHRLTELSSPVSRARSPGAHLVSTRPWAQPANSFDERAIVALVRPGAAGSGSTAVATSCPDQVSPARVKHGARPLQQCLPDGEPEKTPSLDELGLRSDRT